MARLKEHYEQVVRQQLVERFGYKNPMQVPRIDKIVINIAVGEAATDGKKLTSAVGELAKIAGQKPMICRARKSVANFKLRKGMPIGCKVTLRRERMYEFLDRLVTIALPRVRDFRGVSPKSFDGAGNYAFGIKEQIVFPEISLRRGRGYPRHGHHHLHHGGDQRGGKAAPRGVQHAVQDVMERGRHGQEELG